MRVKECGGWRVSVPRRGFRSLLHTLDVAASIGELGFSPPKGIQVFATSQTGRTTSWTLTGFSPPKGIQVFATLDVPTATRGRVSFQSPEGDSGLCYHWVHIRSIGNYSYVSVPRRGFRSLLPAVTGVDHTMLTTSFSPPKGIQVFATRCPKMTNTL